MSLSVFLAPSLSPSVCRATWWDPRATARPRDRADRARARRRVCVGVCACDADRSGVDRMMLRSRPSPFASSQLPFDAFARVVDGDARLRDLLYGRGAAAAAAGAGPGEGEGEGEGKGEAAAARPSSRTVLDTAA